MHRYENLMTGYENFAYYYDQFIQMFSSLDLAGQILTGILIILLAVGIGYLVYGILWLAFQMTKAGILIAIISTYLHFVILKLILVAIMEGNIQAEWTNSVNNMKWMSNVFFPTDSKSFDNRVNNGQTGYNQTQSRTQTQPRIVKVKSGLKSNQYHCTECGSQFTTKMVEAINNNQYAFCESCGQLFVIPNQAPTQV